MTAVAGVVIVCVLLLAIGWLGDKSGAIDALGLRANPTPECRRVEVTKTHIRYVCSGGKEVIEKRKIEGN